MKEEIEYVRYDASRKTFLQEFAIRIKSKKRFILLGVLVGLILGVIVALTTPEIYEAETVVLPQISAGSSISKKYNIASIIGVNLGKPEGNEISPLLYPVLAENVNFRKNLLNSKVNFVTGEKRITYANYLEQYKKSNLLGEIIKKFKGKSELPIQINDKIIEQDSLTKDKPVAVYKNEQAKMDYLKEQLTITFDEDQGYISMVAKSQDPLVASTVLSNARQLLEKLIIEVNVQKSLNELEFIEERLSIAENDYQSKRAKLGVFRDRNQYSITSKTSNREEQLKSEYDLSYEIYSQLASQRESTKLQIAKQTPIFSTIKPIVIPTKPIGPSMMKTIFLFILLASILTLFIVSYKLVVKYVNEVFSLS